MRELRVEDALMYLDQVKMEFGDRPHIYNEFLDIMKNFKSQQLDTPGVIERVSNLFHGNKKLVLGFNTFLPEGYKIELPIDGAPAVYHAPGQVGVTQINGPGSTSRTTSGTTSSMAVAAPPIPTSAAAGRGHAMGSTTHGRAVGPPQVSNKMVQPTMHVHSHPQSGVSAATSLGVVVGQQQQQQQQQQKRFVPSGVPAVTSVASPDTQQALNARQRLAMAERQGRDPAEQAQLQQQPQAARNDHMWKGVRPPSNVMPNTAAIPQQTGMSPAAAVASGPVSSAAVSSIQPPAPGQPVEFDYAINYVTNIKKRFANQPDTYKNFLKILHTYQKEQRGIKEVLNEVSELFADHPDLLQEFTYFLPDAVQAAAKAQLATAVKLAEGRKKKNVQETAAHVAEARTQAILRAKIAYREQKQNIRPVGPPEEPLQRQQPSVGPSDSAGSVAVLPSAVSVPPATPSTAPPQAPQPPPIPFGATQGRSEEREREICRSAVYGQVSFAPVRPPKMLVLSSQVKLCSVFFLFSGASNPLVIFLLLFVLCLLYL